MQTLPDKKFLFVSGIQRSGTTALANTLNWHSEITVCIERFKYLINKNKIHLFNPELFQRDALLDFSTDFTNCTPDHSARFADFYADLANKFSGLKYVGDKIANDPGQIPRIHETFPGAKIIYIVRDLFEIACSWEARATREADKWPSDKTANQAVTPWNEFNAQVVSMWERFPADVYVVDYKNFFGETDGSSDQLDQLMDFLELPTDSGIKEGYTKARNLYARNVRNKQRHLAPEVMEYLAENGDQQLYDRVCGIADSGNPVEIRKAV